MQRTVQQITQQLIDRLPENDQYYRLDELRTWNFPPFIVNRIKIELERNLAESMIIPKTDWANTKSDAVLDAWQQFVDAIRAEARLPASYAKAVIETAVADVLDMLVQPRKNIPEVIFGTNDELTLDEMRNRIKSVVVYRHFATLILRFMEKKELDTLSKKHCASIIKKADQKFTANYSPLNWAQMLKPLFTLIGEEMDPNLLRLFFEDKNMPRLARHFELMNETLTRAELIEAISSPDSLDFEGYKEDQSSLFDGKSAVDDEESGKTDFQQQKNQKDDVPDGESSNFEIIGPKENEDEAQHSVIEESEEKGKAKYSQNEQENSINAGFGFEEKSEPETELESPEEEDDSLNAAFFDQEDEDPVQNNSNGSDGDEDEPAQVEIDSKYEEESEPVESLPTEDTAADEITESEKDSVENGHSVFQKETQDTDWEIDSQEEERPIWMRFMSDEEVEEYKEKLQEEEDEEKEEANQEETNEEEFLDEPIIDLTEEEESSEEEIKKLREELSDDRELFVEEIFRGSERAYDEAIENIAAFESWRDASKYIQKDIFKRNLVDMYSEAAVDFTDRLQSYFSEK